MIVAHRCPGDDDESLLRAGLASRLIAAGTLKKVHLELGGKAPVVIFDDVALEPAFEVIAGSAYYNAGQDCTAAGYRVLEAFTTRS